MQSVVVSDVKNVHTEIDVRSRLSVRQQELEEIKNKETHWIILKKCMNVIYYQTTIRLNCIFSA
jgi:hypothetical protein